MPAKAARRRGKGRQAILAASGLMAYAEPNTRAAAIAVNKLDPGGFEGGDEPCSGVPPAAKRAVPGFQPLDRGNGHLGGLGQMTLRPIK